MLICLACRRQDGDHSLNCSYLAGYEDSELARAFMDENADLFESERLTHPIGGGPKRVPIQTTDEFLLAILADQTRLDAQSLLRATRALMSWPEDKS